MKLLKILFAIFIASFSLNAQTYTESFDSVFINVSYADATTGILYERSLPFANFK